MRKTNQDCRTHSEHLHRRESDSSEIGDSDTGQLTREDLEHVDRVGVQLNGVLRNVVHSIESGKRSIRGVSDALRIGRKVSERTLAASRIGISGRQAVIEAPGVDALKMFGDALRAAGIDAAVCEQVDAVIVKYARLIERLGPSQARLLSKLRVAELSEAGKDDTTSQYERIRRHTYRYNRDLCGAEAEFNSLIVIYRDLPEDPNFFEHFGASTLLGCRTRKYGLPIVLTASISGLSQGDEGRIGGAARPVNTSQEWSSSGTVLHEFSTSPLPIVTAQGRSTAVTNIIDLDSESGQAADIVIARRYPRLPHFRTLGNVPGVITSSRVRTPTKRLVIDVYVSDSMLPPEGPTFSVVFRPQESTLDPNADWPEHLPGAPTIQPLGRGIGNAEHPAWSRHGELTRYLFEKMGCPPSQVTGFRADVAYPLWGALYRMSFDLTENAGRNNVPG